MTEQKEMSKQGEIEFSVRHTAKMPVSGELLRQMFLFNSTDLVIVGGNYDIELDTFNFFVSDNKGAIIPETKQGDIIPIMVPIFQVAYTDGGISTVCIKEFRFTARSVVKLLGEGVLPS